MAIDNFKPTIWANEALLALKKRHVFPGLVNTDYQGQITAMGDTVKINGIGALTIGTDSRSISYEDLTDNTRSLLIDQERTFAFKIDDVDDAQSNPNLMQTAMGEAAYGLADATDAYLAGLVTDAGIKGAAAGLGVAGSPLELSSQGVLSLLSNLNKLMSENNVPTEGRSIILPPWAIEKLNIQSLYMGFNTTKNEEIIQNGYVGSFYGFNVFMSNNVATDDPASPTEWYIPAFTRPAISFAEQIASVEAMRLESSFSDAVRGLHLFGAKVVRPEALAMVVAVPGAEA